MESQSAVGTYNEENGAYEKKDASVALNLTNDGLVARLACDGVPTRDIYIERLPCSWRINVALDIGDDIIAQVEITDDGEVTFD
ncbi:MAG: hypothetical protein M1346_01130 [Gammaproteobacteria bacterium]|nr:hypothetical protein [Gammaproteobacteria bacterium]